MFVIKNNSGHYLSKSNDWVDGSNGAEIFRSPHKDIALNTVFDQTSKHIELRAKVVEVEIDEKGLPIVEVCTEGSLFEETTAEATA